MGNSQSSGLGNCLLAAVGGSSSNLALPSKPLYQVTDVKAYNLDIAVSPVAVTYPTTAEQVSAIVKCASQYSVPVQPKSGGHSYANYALGGGDGVVVVDLKNFQQFSMDNSTWEAKIGGGTLLGDVTKRLHNNGGRAMAHGTCPQVGIGGHATIGGLGPTSRLWGSALDHVVAAEVVTADGSIVQASELENPDLFWALKGAGAGFGIITEFTVRTHAEPAETVQYSYNLNLGSAADMATAFKAWQSLISNPSLTRKFASQVVIMEIGMIISGTYFGPKSEFDALKLDSVFPKPFSSNIVVFDDWLGQVAHWGEEIALEVSGGIPSPFYSKSLAFTNQTLIPDSGIDNFFQYIKSVDKGTAIWFAIFDLEGGAINDVAPDATSYGHRDALFYLQTYAVNINLQFKVTQKTRSFVTNMSSIIEKALPNVSLGAYAGYVDPMFTLEEAQQKYWGSNLPKLKQVKTKVDPKDVFHNPQSIRPNA